MSEKNREERRLDVRGEHVEGGEHPEGADDGVEEVDDLFVLGVVRVAGDVECGRAGCVF